MLAILRYINPRKLGSIRINIPFKSQNQEMSKIDQDCLLDALPAGQIFRTCLTYSQMSFLTTLLPHGYSFQKTRLRRRAINFDLTVSSKTEQFSQIQLQGVQPIDSPSNQQMIDRYLIKDHRGENRAGICGRFPMQKHQKALVLIEKCVKWVGSCYTAQKQFGSSLRNLQKKLRILLYPTFDSFEDEFVATLNAMKKSKSRIVNQLGRFIQKQFFTFLDSSQNEDKQDQDCNLPISCLIKLEASKEEFIEEKQTKIRSIALKKQRKKKKILFSHFRRKTRMARRRIKLTTNLPTIPEESQSFLETSIDQALTCDEVANITNLLRQLCTLDKQKLLNTLMNSQNLCKLVKNLNKKDASTFIDQLLLTFDENALKLNDSQATDACQCSEAEQSNSI